ncbi:MAG: YgjV family protein [Shimia sp.]
MLGVIAGLAVIVAFYCRRPGRMRVWALVSNMAFILYGVVLGLWPVVLLHGVLIPLNIHRLGQVRATGTSVAPTRGRADATLARGPWSGPWSRGELWNLGYPGSRRRHYRSFQP